MVEIALFDRGWVTDNRQTNNRQQTTDGRLIAYSERNVVRSLKTKNLGVLNNVLFIQNRVVLIEAGGFY